MSLLADDRRSCPECPGKTRLELDYSAGDLICTACGLVVMSQCFDDAQEWRNFAQEGVENGPRVDSRARSDSFLTLDKAFGEVDGTSISAGGGQTAEDLRRAMIMMQGQVVTSTANRQAKAFAEKVQHEGRRHLNLNEDIIDKCLEHIKTLADLTQIPKKVTQQHVYALIHIASSELSSGRTVKELARARAQSGSTKQGALEKGIEKCVKELRKILSPELEKAIPLNVAAEERVPRVRTRLQLPPELDQPISHAVSQASKYRLFQPGQPKAEAAFIAASVYIVCFLKQQPAKSICLDDVAQELQVEKAAVQKAYKELKAFINSILPKQMSIDVPGGVKALPPAIPCRSAAPSA